MTVCGLSKWRMMKETTMPRGDKDSYTDKQKRKAEHIEEGYEDRGVSKKEAESRAWATVNKESGGGKKSGSGRGKKESHASSSRGGKAHKSGSAEQRSAAARKGWDTRRKNEGK
jgi:plasmid stabilization system protein ParE